MDLSSPTDTTRYKVSTPGLSQFKKQVVGRTRNPVSHLWLQHTSRIYHIPLPFVSKFFSVTYCMNLVLRDSSDILCNKNNGIRLYEDQNMSATHREALRAAWDTRVAFDRFALQRKRGLQDNQQLSGHI